MTDTPNPGAEDGLESFEARLAELWAIQQEALEAFGEDHARTCEPFYRLGEETVDRALRAFLRAPCLLQGAGSAVPTRWVLVAEVMDDEGERLVHVMTSANLVEWEVAGLAAHAVRMLGG